LVRKRSLSPMIDEEYDEDEWVEAPWPPPEPEPEMIHIIRDGMTGAPLAVFDLQGDVDQWLADFDDEPTRFTVTSFPGTFVQLVLEKEGELLPIHESQLWNSKRALRGGDEIACRIFRFTKRLTEEDMKTAEVYTVDQAFIEEAFTKDLPWEEDPSEEDAKWMFTMPEVDDEELKKIAMGVHSGTIFSTDHMGAHDMNLVGSVFMPMLLGGIGYARHSLINNITFVYEYLSEAGPRCINGMPIFFSCRMLNREQHKRMYKKLDAIKAALEAV